MILRLALIMTMFLGCSTPSLYVEDRDTIGIEMDGKRIGTAVKEVKKDRVALDGVWVERTQYETREGDQIVYEAARTQAPYAFQYEVERSLRIIFEAKSVTRLKRIGNLGFYYIQLRDGSGLFAIAQNLNKKGIDMLYGLSRAQMTQAVADLGEKAVIEQEAQPLPEHEAIISRWNPKMTILDGLLEVQGGRPYMQ